jgi:catechol 2,3-dioxygenase-like lactoylglutathione lyase family enzyme
MRLCHLSLAVSDPAFSRRFYARYLGFAGDGEPDGEGCLHLTDADGFDLTLAPGPMAPPPSSLHFGIRVRDAGSVRRLLERLTAENVPAGDLYEAASKVAFHCTDPDGYRIEIFWSPTADGT